MLTLRVGLAASVGKDLQRPDLNEDMFAISDTTTRVAIADGASKSYDSGKWARILADAFVLEPNVSPEWLQTLVDCYASKTDFDALPWSAQAAFERGSFSTLLGIELLTQERAARLLAVGDSIALHTRNRKVIASYPFDNSMSFRTRPELLSTQQGNNVFFTDIFIAHAWTTWPLIGGDSVYLMTDAVGEWVLRSVTGDKLAQLDLITSGDDFTKLILWLRKVRGIRLDDSTFIRVSVEEPV